MTVQIQAEPSCTPVVILSETKDFMPYY